MPLCTLTLTVWNRGYLCASYTYQGEAPTEGCRLTYRRGTTPRHGKKYADVWPSSNLTKWKAECTPGKLKEWQDMILPQNGFALVAPDEHPPPPPTHR